MTQQEQLHATDPEDLSWIPGTRGTGGQETKLSVSCCPLTSKQAAQLARAYKQVQKYKQNVIKIKKSINHKIQGGEERVQQLSM